jgi:succinyl-CoA synthetase beta subunit
MKLYEFEGSSLFRREGIPLPEFAVAADPRVVRQKAAEIGLPVVVKAQVLTGGRGLAGGVHAAETLDEAEEAARRILSTSIGGLPVHQVMVAKKVEVAEEFYLSVTIDAYNSAPLVILSTAGGILIEDTAKAHPERVVRRQVSMASGLSLSEAIGMAEEAGLGDTDAMAIADTIHTLYRIFRKYDGLLVEINPFVRTAEGTYISLDAKVEIDDASLYRHSDLQLSSKDRIFNALERKADQLGIAYVDLDGEIGIITSGAGLGMATMDIISQRFRPANFLETGGAITAQLAYQAMGLVLQKKGLKAVFINLYGGINPMHEGAKGIVRYLQQHPTTIPVMAKALGNRQEETWQILESGGVKVATGVATETGIAQLAGLLEEAR